MSRSWLESPNKDFSQAGACMQIDAFLYINGIEVVNKIKKDKGFYFFFKNIMEWNKWN